MISPVSYWRNKKNAYTYLNKKGTLLSFTKINNPPQGFGNHAYLVGIIALEDGNKTTAQLIAEGKEPKIGAPVIGVIRKTRKADVADVIPYGVKFKLI